jgi:hypothetical protein
MIQEHYLRAIINGSLNTSMQKNFVHECHELVMGFVELRFEKELRNGGEITNILQETNYVYIGKVFILIASLYEKVSIYHFIRIFKDSLSSSNGNSITSYNPIISDGDALRLNN